MQDLTAIQISLLLEHIDHATPASAHDSGFGIESWADSRRSSAAPESTESDYSGPATGDATATVTVDGTRPLEV